jgi:hypothetical protein
MQMLYDSEGYVVVVCDAHLCNDSNPHNAGKDARNIFEIVDKKSSLSVVLDGQWAEAFQAQISRWQVKTPHMDEVEATLESYTQLAYIPLVMH